MGSDSKQLFTEAQRWIPGGVNSPGRAWAAVGLEPRFVAEAEGARIRDVEGRDYIDYVGSWGPMLLGHRDPAVTRAVTEAVARGTSFGATTAGEVELARRLCRRFASLERVRLVSSGTEATMSALRLARAATGRGSIIKFAGCYHGHSDGLLVAAGSGASTFGVPDSPGVPEDYAALTRERLLVGAFHHAVDYVQATRMRRKLTADVEQAMDGLNAIVVVSNLDPPCRIDAPDAIAKSYVRQARTPFNVTGQPSIAFPCGFTEAGLPLSIQIAGRPFDEASVYRIAQAFEQATDWKDRHPTLKT